MDISFVIPCIRDYPQIIMTINNIQVEMENTGLSYEIIYVENGFVDPYTEKFLQAYRVPIKRETIRYAFEPHQCGPAARMKGVEMAKGTHVMFMDSHTTLGKNSVSLMVNSMEELDAGIIHGATTKTHIVPPHVRGLHYRLFGNRGPCLNTHMHGAYSRAGQGTPYLCVGANLAYTLFKTRELIELRGYHPKCQFYPHPEGYLPLKYLMMGRQPWAVPKAFHLHSVYRNPGSHGKPRWDIEIRGDPHSLVGNDHLICNAMICAYTLGGEKWLNILYDSWAQKMRSKYILKGIRDYARGEAEEEYNWVQNNMEHTLDEVLIDARKNKIKGMENWFKEISPDPLG